MKALLSYQRPHLLIATQAHRNRPNITNLFLSKQTFQRPPPPRSELLSITTSPEKSSYDNHHHQQPLAHRPTSVNSTTSSVKPLSHGALTGITLNHNSQPTTHHRYPHLRRTGPVNITSLCFSPLRSRTEPAIIHRSSEASR